VVLSFCLLVLWIPDFRSFLFSPPNLIVAGSLASVAGAIFLIVSSVRRRLPILTTRVLPVLWLLAVVSFVIFIVLVVMAAASRNPDQVSLTPLDITAGIASLSTLLFSLAAQWWASVKHLSLMCEIHPPEPGSPRWGGRFSDLGTY
jgi:hypothetical protein